MSYEQHAVTDGSAINQSVIFQHPRMSDDLVLTVNPYDVVWGYGLNTANYPTYGGEVVQILSMFFDDMTISGEVRAYSDIERIYHWFATYMQVASQGTDGSGSYDHRPVIFKYPRRSWEFQIYPKALPGFRYARDIAVCTYTITAAVLEPELQTADDLKTLIMSEAQFQASMGDDIDTFGKATAAIGFREDNPFSGPTSQVYQKPDSFKQGNQALGDFFTNLIPSWLDGDFKDVETSSKIPDKIANFIKDLSGTQKKTGRSNKGKGK
jgi:hypothetical protein